MAIGPLLEAAVFVGGTDFSDHITSVTINAEGADLDATNFASEGWQEHRVGLLGGTLDIEWQQDYATSSVDAVVYAAWIARSAVAVRVRADEAAISSANPEYQFNVRVTQYTPVGGAVGEMAVFSTSWPLDGAITRDTTP